MKRQRFYEFESKNSELPTFVLDVLGHLKQHGAEVEGIFRLTKDRDHSAEIIKGYSEGAKPDLSKCSAHAVAGAFGFYFSQLQEPLLTYPLYDVIKEAINIRSEETRVQLLKKAMRHLPVGNKAFLTHVIELFKYLLSYSDVNMLHIDYLTSVFGLSIWAMHPTAENQDSSADWQRLCKRLLETLIYKYEELLAPKKQKKKKEDKKEDTKVNKKEFKKKLKRLSLATPMSPITDHVSLSSQSTPYNSQHNSNSKLSSNNSSPSSRPTSPTGPIGTTSKPLAIAIPIHQVHQHVPSPSYEDSLNEFKGPFSAPTDSFDKYYQQQTSPRNRYGGNPYISPLHSVHNSNSSNTTSGTTYQVHLEVPTIEDSLDSSLEDSSNVGSSKARRTASKPVVASNSGGLDGEALRALKHTKSIANIGKKTPHEIKQSASSSSRVDGVDDRRVRTAVLSLIDHVIRGRTQQLHKYLTGLTRPELKQVSVELCYYIETIFKEQSDSSSEEGADSSEFSDELSEYQN